MGAPDAIDEPLSGSWAPASRTGRGAAPRRGGGGYLKGILARDRVVLARAITLIESTRSADQILARELVNQVVPHAGRSIRIGITGAPGSGKSALIEKFGGMLTAQHHRVAVLTVDPSSERSGGSLLSAVIRR
jgi:LAO/AO transport system kinase